jgi:para-aminobenzoate synthetase component 2
MTRVLVVDNYDSFVFNLVHYLAALGAQVDVRRNDALEPAEPLRLGVDAVLVSPGPGRPEDAGVCVELVRAVAGTLPVLGVCLGHQAIAAAYGARVVRAPELLHGKTSEVHHGGDGVFAGLPDPMTATRYHSLAVDPATLPDDLEVTARTASGVVMGLRHRTLPLEGVQFHPESVLTDGGHRMLANWMASAGFPVAPERVDELEAGMRRLAAAAATV